MWAWGVVVVVAVVVVTVVAVATVAAVAAVVAVVVVTVVAVAAVVAVSFFSTNGLHIQYRESSVVVLKMFGYIFTKSIK